MWSRRRFLSAGGLALAGLGVPRASRAARTVEIALRSDPDGAEVWFDPIGVLIQPGDTVRWVVRENVHTSTAYHPKNDNHSLRIPEMARPWDSGILVEPGAHFDVTLTVPGVYDYFCMPHEAAGMVGRIVVGRAAGPGAQPFDYFKGRHDWKPVPAAAQRMFPPVERIIRERVVRRTK